mmetsp:Transcript_6477/g.13566  ORF Transcript_6477/g.13566 Transcript_6477/m.13566 type:complete len:502 (-) Transcript_6477:189-1694(-)
MADQLISNDCNTVGKAIHMLSEETGLLVLRPGRPISQFFYFTIPSGMYALVTRHGADVDHPGLKSAVWPAGLYLSQPPWVRVSNLVTMQSVVFDLPVKGCKTKDNVTVQMDVSIVFRILGDASRGEDPELVRTFVHRLGPRGLQQQLTDAMDEAVRGIARSMTHTEVYGARSGGRVNSALLDASKIDDDGSAAEETKDDVFEGSSNVIDKIAAKKASQKGEDVTEKMRVILERQFAPQGVGIEDVMIKSVTLPADITQQMQQKTMIISANAQQRMQHENEMQTTRMNEQIETLFQTFHETREAEVTSGEERVSREQILLNDAKADAKKNEANIKEEYSLIIDRLKADTSLEVQRITDNMTFELEKMEADAKKAAAELKADTQLQVQTLISEASYTAAKNNAQKFQILSEAEGKIAPWLEKKNQFATKEKEMSVYNSLAENKDLVISGSSNSDINMISIADAILHANNHAKGNSRSALIAELALMNKGTAPYMGNNGEKIES